MSDKHIPTQQTPMSDDTVRQVAAAEAEVDRLSEINRQLVRDYNILNCEQAKIEEATRQAEADNARLRAERDEALEALAKTQRLVSEAALHGFAESLTAEELFRNNGPISTILKKYGMCATQHRKEPTP